MQTTPRTLAVGALAVVAALVAAMVLFWPGPLALDDRIPVGLLFAVPAAVLADELRRSLA